MQTTRSLLFYTLTATLPLVVISAILLFTRMKGAALVSLSLIGVICGIVGFGRLLYETTFDIAGYPDYKLPVWSVFYLIVYLISTYMFLIFALHIGRPDYFFEGFPPSEKAALLDALYISACSYIGRSPDTFIMKTQTARFLTVSQGILSMFLNVVIITKFVNAF